MTMTTFDRALPLLRIHVPADAIEARRVLSVLAAHVAAVANVPTAMSTPPKTSVPAVTIAALGSVLVAADALLDWYMFAAQTDPSLVRDDLVGQLHALASITRWDGGVRVPHDVILPTAPNTPREALADYAHAAWSGWMVYLFQKSHENPDGSVTIPPELVRRWRRQMVTAYAELPANEQASDLAEADAMLSRLWE